MLTVWMSAWQMQCCGKPFSVGSRVEWTLGTDPDRDFLASVLGDEVAGEVTHWEDHHGGLPDDAPTTEGVVRSIRVSRCRYGPDTERDVDTMYPLKESGTLTAVTSADGRDGDHGDVKIVGYVITIDAA